jgi:hypothetical protein
MLRDLSADASNRADASGIEQRFTQVDNRRSSPQCSNEPIAMWGKLIESFKASETVGW